jgi:hypothetical protein
MGTEYYNKKKCEGKATGVLAISKSVTALLDTDSSFIGSNSWVIQKKPKMEK